MNIKKCKPREFDQGMAAFLAGDSTDKCPYESGSQKGSRVSWMKGWYSARIERNLQEVFTRNNISWP